MSSNAATVSPVLTPPRIHAADQRGSWVRRQHPWLQVDGPVLRSADHDPRNQVQPLSYTSLLVDLAPLGTP